MQVQDPNTCFELINILGIDPPLARSDKSIKYLIKNNIHIININYRVLFCIIILRGIRFLNRLQLRSDQNGSPILFFTAA